jgi:hypothetical protein
MATIEPAEYTLIPFETYNTLEEKLQALLNGELIYIKKFERQEGADIIARLIKKKFTVTQITYDTKVTSLDDRYWVTFNLGINDLEMFTCFKFKEGIFSYTNKYMVNDMVYYESTDAPGGRDSAIVEEVYVSITDPKEFAYRLSRDGQIYAEKDLLQNPYM